MDFEHGLALEWIVLLLFAAIPLCAWEIFWGIRLVLGYNRLVTTMLGLNLDELGRLPHPLPGALSSRWVRSFGSPLFHEVVFGNISWADGHSTQSVVRSVRRDARMLLVGFAAVGLVLFLQLIATRH
jgi:prepilin-type processing-associated H-X9-DG protein